MKVQEDFARVLVVVTRLSLAVAVGLWILLLSSIACETYHEHRIRQDLQSHDDSDWWKQ